MVYFPPLDWIILVSSYRPEFNSLLTPQDFQHTVSSLKFGESGYAFVVDRDGAALIHPTIKGLKVFRQSGFPPGLARRMMAQGEGALEYDWKNPDDKRCRRKLAAFKSIPDYGWVVVSAAYLDEVMGWVSRARYLGYGALALLLLMGAMVSYYLSGRLLRPINQMIGRLDANARRGESEPLPLDAGSKELSRLGREFNAFLATIKAQNGELKSQRARYRSLF